MKDEEIKLLKDKLKKYKTKNEEKNIRIKFTKKKWKIN